MNRAFVSLPLIASVGLASCTNSTAGPDASARAVQQGSASPTLAIHPSGSSDREAIATTDPLVAPKPAENLPSKDDRQREQIVGVWKQFETGVRWLRVRPDGTATMFIDPAGDWVTKAVIGNGLTMQIEWSITDGRVLMKSVSGEPSSAFKAVSTLYGTDRNRGIAHLDDETFVMLDDSDGSKSEWTRVAPTVSLPKGIEN